MSDTIDTADNNTSTALVPPPPAPAVEPEEAERKVPLPAERQSELGAQAEAFVNGVIEAEPESEPFRAHVQQAHQLGNQQMQEAAQVSNRLLDKPVRAMDQGALSGDSHVSRSLLDLRRIVEQLDPSRRDNLFQPRKLLGFIPWGNRLHDYFSEYQSAQTHLDAIINSLYAGQDELRRDNAAIDEEKRHLWGIMQSIEEHVYLARAIDTRLEQRVDEIAAQNEHKARMVREEMLFYMRQKVLDLQQQLGVAVQGYMALDMIRKNNLELIKGVDRATSVTVSALRTATVVAQALTNQRLVLEQIQALNETTGNVIEGTSEIMRTQSAQIHEQAASSTIDMDQLTNAFNNIYATMDDMTDFKTKALDNMKQTVESLDGQINKARERMQRSGDAHAAAAE
ncbi:toxic anion resistance protein [Halomonas sp. ML-15]|uniref:toxic anion resistance protein n=1 Tax=Halomonas sp. ML-15 TaxID=2773305 RepID=UPI001745E5F6|nr:toxic anion resistance protein [Halomonas sp. ML-15]MBD3895515.1 toxic anion resistance protein [Halomonas sp. ML-15]